MWVAVWVALLPSLAAMRVDPERIAARLRIEGEIENDRLARSGRPRRQLQPKEISIQVTAPLFSSRLFEYGKDAGDSEIPPALDVGKIVKLTNPMNFFGKDYHTIYVLSNGAIGFDSSSRSYKADVLGSAARLIAPFWNRNDLRNGGRVYYREVTKGRVLERGQSEIRYQYDKHVKVTSALVVTWEQMQPLGAAPLPEENTNTFQCALFVTANGTFANFIYSNIGWTQGAEAGFYSGDNKKFYSLPTSGTGNIMYLEEYGNTGIPGEWMFEMQKDSILRCKMGIKGDTCDEECSKGEWGADCASCCHCGQGTCHPLTGECPRGCASCWTGTNCQQKTESCHARSSVKCAANAVAFTDYDRCGEPVPRCGCLEGFTGDGFKKCVDIDECQNSTACHSEAICTNTPGRFFCQCKGGFSGDGKNECVATFLYASEGHQELPKSKNAKVAWQLKNPLKILGQMQDQLVITTSGLISLADVTVSSSQLDEIQMTGIAPFFAPIDTTRSGHVTVAEVTDSETLTRVTRMVADQFGDPSFLAKSVLIVTYMNVTNGSSQRDNTLQSVLIGGTNDAGDDRTYVQLLYKQMSWGNGAEAGIMTNDVSTSLSLPGSGNEGIEQLPHLSNIKQPGIWMYRIDEPSIMPCPLESQQPPYCDVEKPQTEQHAVVPEPKTPVPNVEANLDKKSEEMRIQKVPVGAPRFITPVLEEPPSRTPVRQSTTNIPVTAAPIAPERKETTRTTRPRPQFESTPHRPLVSLGNEDFEIEPDVFAPIDEDIGTFAPFVTVVPEVFVPESKKATRKQLPDFTIPQAVPVSSTSSTVQPTFPTFQLENQTEAVETLQQEIESEESSEDEGVLLPEEPIQSIERTSENQAIPETTTDSTTEEMEMTATMEDEDSELPSTTQRATTSRKESPAKPIFIFSTTPRSQPTTRATPARTKPVILTAPPTVDETEKTPESDAAHASKLAIIIPTGIVAVWVVLLVVIALVVCCRRRNSEAQLRAMYGPTYGVRPTGYALKRGSKNLEGSYEDHLEKAARISNEMTAYNQSGRVSLYGSYWNLNNSSSSPGSGPSSRQSPPFNGYAPTRYPYAGRY